MRRFYAPSFKTLLRYERRQIFHGKTLYNSESGVLKPLKTLSHKNYLLDFDKNAELCRPKLLLIYETVLCP